MKIAVFTDAHANLPATKAVLKAIEAEGCDRIYHLGDAVAIGPQPAETLDLLLNTPRMRLIMGNHDYRFVHGMPDVVPDNISPGELEHQAWTRAQLDPALREVVAQWPLAIREEWGGHRVAFLHYGLSLMGTAFVPSIRNATPEDMDGLYADQDAEYVFFGHHHSHADLQGRARYMNPGALGCSRAAEVRFYIAEFGRGEPRIEFRLAPYDDGPLFEAFEARRVPEREFIYQRFMGRRFSPPEG
jgi:predicted phosphodiesterase